MSVMGFREAYAEAVRVNVDRLPVFVVSPVGLMLLKLVAWAKRHHVQPRKDAADMAYLLRHFAKILTEETLFAHHMAAIEAASYDLDVAAASTLGTKIAAMAADDTREFNTRLINDELREETDSLLVREVAEHMGGFDCERTYLLLESLKGGLIDART